MRWLCCGKSAAQASRDDHLVQLDLSHSNLQALPVDLYKHVHNLQELLLDANQLQRIPQSFCRFHRLERLIACDNELTALPSAIGNLTNLEELDISKNGLTDIPESIKDCKALHILDISVNPLSCFPDAVSQLFSLTHLYLNDLLLDSLPVSFGRLTKLKILELRENKLVNLPKSFCQLQQLERLDLGSNNIVEMPEVVGSLGSLRELWLDSNQICSVSAMIGNVVKLQFLDLSCNCLESLPAEIGCLQRLLDFHMTSNRLVTLPETIGRLENLSTLKADDNHLSIIPTSIGCLQNLTELVLSGNEIEALPSTIGFLRKLTNLNLDENRLQILPNEICSCISLTILSLRRNDLTRLPADIGRLAGLVVLSVASNLLDRLPFSLTKLKNLKALWLSENQGKPLIPLQTEYDTGEQVHFLTCYMFPQQPYEDHDAWVPSPSEAREQEWNKRSSVVFDVEEEASPEFRLSRQPTPYPKDVRHRVEQYREHMIAHSAQRTAAAAAGGPSVGGPAHSRHDHAARHSAEFISIHADAESTSLSRRSTTPWDEPTYSQESPLGVAGSASSTPSLAPVRIEGTSAESNQPKSPLVYSGLSLRPANSTTTASLPSTPTKNLDSPSPEDIGGHETHKYSSVDGKSVLDSNHAPSTAITSDPSSPVFRVSFHKCPNFGFGISGGLGGSANPFSDNDQSIFVTKVSENGPAWGILKPGDKILQVNGTSFLNVTHLDAVALFQESSVVDLVVQRVAI